jgi:hypothetical protein
MRTLLNTLFIIALITASTAVLRSSSKPEPQTAAGVTVVDQTLVSPGYTLYNSTRKPFAALIDHFGNEVHRWQIRQIVPNKGFHHVEPLTHGQLLAISTDRALFKLGRDSEVLWKTHGHFHHDLKVLSSGRIYALTRKKRTVTKNGVSAPVLDDYISILKDDGTVLEEISLFDVLAPIVPDSSLRKAHRYAIDEQQEVTPDSPADIFHTNSLDILEVDVSYAPAGAALVSLRELNTLALIDVERKVLLWHWGEGELEAQHDASFQRDGTILVFDNGIKRELSRVLKVDPTDNSVIWQFGAKPGQKFFSKIRGGVQKLQNGNYLITNAVRDSAFEINPNGDKVWRTRLRKNQKKGSAKTIKHSLYRMTRIPPEDTFLTLPDGSHLYKTN